MLDPNSVYAYLLLAEHFGGTCVVAELNPPDLDAGKRIAGFVTAYRPPDKPDVVFVWQVGVASWAQQQGLATRLLTRLIGAPGAVDARYLEATITDSNSASQRLFASFADRVGAPINQEPGFNSAELGGHEAESLYRIGPLPADRSPYQE